MNHSITNLVEKHEGVMTHGHDGHFFMWKMLTSFKMSK